MEGKKSWTEFVVKDNLTRLLEYQQLRRKNPRAVPRKYELRVVDRAGGVRDVLVTVAMIPGTRKSVASFLDITKRKQAEEALKQANAYLANVFENSPDPIGIVDRHGKFIMWNNMAEELYGYSFEELRGKSGFDLYADMDQLNGMLKHLRQEGSVHRWEMQMKRKDGSVVPCELSIGLLLDHEHRTLGSVCVARDLSEIKRVLAELQTSNEKLRQEVADRLLAEQELGKYRDHLKELVQERTRELAKTNEQLTREIEERKRVEEALKEASEKLKLFAYSVAHDLKSPAVGIYGLTRRLHKQYRDLIDDKGRNYCDQILKAAEHIAALVEKINLFIATKEARLSFEKISFRDILTMIKEEFSSQLSLRQIDWIEPDTVIEIKADRLSMLRVLRNLVDNSLKYGGERLSRICIGYEEAPDFHVFSVSDNGRGLKEEDAERIFRPFQRNETSKGVEGAGLGLTIVKEIAEQHGGKVWVESRSQKGTTLTLSISKYCATE